MKQRLLDKTGSVSLFGLLLLSVLIPMFLFITVELTHYWDMKTKFQGITDSVALAAITEIDEANLPYGVIKIDETRAEDKATDLFCKNLGLNTALEIIDSSNSLLSANPTLKVYVVNDVPAGGTTLTTDEGMTFNLSKPSVVVYTAIRPRNLITKNSIANIQCISVYEVQFRSPSAQLVIGSSPLGGDQIDIYSSNVVNPARFNSTYPFSELQWEFANIPFSAGAQTTISATMNGTWASILSFDAQIILSSGTYNNVLTLPMTPGVDKTYNVSFILPNDCPVGATVDVRILSTAITPGGITQNLVAPDSGMARFGYIDNNIHDLLMFCKI